MQVLLTLISRLATKTLDRTFQTSVSSIEIIKNKTKKKEKEEEEEKKKKEEKKLLVYEIYLVTALGGGGVMVWEGKGEVTFWDGLPSQYPCMGMKLEQGGVGNFLWRGTVF